MKKLSISIILLSSILFVSCEKSMLKEKDDYFAQQEELLQEISCSICQETITEGEKVIKLDCTNQPL